MPLSETEIHALAEKLGLTVEVFDNHPDVDSARDPLRPANTQAVSFVIRGWKQLLSDTYLSKSLEEARANAFKTVAMLLDFIRSGTMEKRLKSEVVAC